MVDLGSRQVCVGTLVSVVCWKAGLWLILLACFKVLAHPWSMLGLAVITAGCMTTLCSQHREMQSRERMAFEMGRESMKLVRT